MADNINQQYNEMSTIDACILIEETCAAIYNSFAGIFVDSPKIYTLWKEIAMEEERHADEFRAAKSIQSSSCKCSDIENNLIKTILEQLKSLNASITGESMSLRDALLTALIMEKTVEKYHLEASKEVIDPEVARLLKVMTEYSHGHIETLRLATDSIDTSS